MIQIKNHKNVPLDFGSEVGHNASQTSQQDLTSEFFNKVCQKVFMETSGRKWIIIYLPK